MSALPVVVLGALLAASHDGAIDGDRIEWRSTFVADGDRAARIDFAAPLPAGLEWTLPDGASVVTGPEGEVVALSIADEAWRARGHAHAFSITLRQPISRDAAVRLAPIASGGAVQRVTLVAGGEVARFVPDGSLGIEQHLTHAVSRGVTAKRRAHCDELLGESPSRSKAAWTAYVISDRALEAYGLTGRIRTGRPSRTVALAVAAGFAAVVVAVAMLYRALDRRAREEQDEAILRTEVARMRARLEGEAR